MLFKGRFFGWFGKRRLDDKAWRTKAEFLIKNGAIIAGGFWVLFAGTALIDKRSKLLSREAIPNADTRFTPFPDGKHIHAQLVEDGAYCEVSGQYAIQNIGKLAFRIEKVEFRVVELPRFSRASSKAEVVSFSLNPRINRARELTVEPILVGETFGPGNIMERSFGYSFKMPSVRPDGTRERRSYVISANAQGGLVESEFLFSRLMGDLLLWLRLYDGRLTSFQSDDLRIDTAPIELCVTPSD